MAGLVHIQTATLGRFSWQPLHYHVERLAAVQPSHQLLAQEQAGLLQRLHPLNVALLVHGEVDLSQGALAGGGHAPGEEPATVQVSPGIFGLWECPLLHGHNW